MQLLPPLLGPASFILQASTFNVHDTTFKYWYKLRILPLLLQAFFPLLQNTKLFCWLCWHILIWSTILSTFSLIRLHKNLIAPSLFGLLLYIGPHVDHNIWLRFDVFWLDHRQPYSWVLGWYLVCVYICSQTDKYLDIGLIFGVFVLDYKQNYSFWLSRYVLFILDHWRLYSLRLNIYLGWFYLEDSLMVCYWTGICLIIGGDILGDCTNEAALQAEKPIMNFFLNWTKIWF